MKKVIYFHGAAGSPKSAETQFKNPAEVLAPSIHPDFFTAQQDLKIFIENNTNMLDEVVFVGTSLGGYWANYMGVVFQRPVLLINPCVSPQISLQQIPEYEPGSRWYPDIDCSSVIPRIVLLTKDDAQLDYNIAKILFSDTAEVVVFEDGGHQFKNPEVIDKYVEELFNSSFYLCYHSNNI